MGGLPIPAGHLMLAFYRRWGMRAVGSVVFRLGDDDQTDSVLVRSLSV